MRGSVTYDFGVGRDRSNLERIYDRLRKQSLRWAKRETPWKKIGIAWPRNQKAPWEDKWEWWDHAAYTAGVRDALNTVKKEGL